MTARNSQNNRAKFGVHRGMKLLHFRIKSFLSIVYGFVFLHRPCGDGMSTVTEQVKKYRNRLKIRDSERFADFGSLLGSLFSCFDNSVIVCLLIG